VRALQEADLMQLYKDTVNEAADSAASVAGALPTDPPFSQGWLLREITREYDQIHAAALQDTSLFTNAEFEQAITDLKTFAQNRTAIVKQQIGK
jgi:hypothetical protein